MEFTALRDRFRDDAQRNAAADIVHDRLADDRNQDECRYLMRFRWQLSMPYVEVTMGQLEEHVRPERLAVIVALLDAMERGHDAIDAWIEETSRVWPVVEDRGFALRRENESGDD